MTGITFVRLKDSYHTTWSKYFVEIGKTVDMEEIKHKTKYIGPFIVIRGGNYNIRKREKMLLKFGKLQYFGN